jgi:hypothetical protein
MEMDLLDSIHLFWLASTCTFPANAGNLEKADREWKQATTAIDQHAYIFYVSACANVKESGDDQIKRWMHNS